MNQHKSVDAAVGNKPRGDRSLTERSRSTEKPVVMFCERIRGLLLFQTKRTVECYVDFLPARAFIAFGASQE